MIVKKNAEEKLDFLTTVTSRLERLDSEYREISAKIELNKSFIEQRLHSIYLELKSQLVISYFSYMLIDLFLD
jgi:hypothetical protein